MDNIFENAKFGDKFLCKNGTIAIFHRAFMKSSYYLIVAEICDRIEYNSDGTCRGDSEWDIISRYKKTIDENIIDICAHCADSEYIKSVGKVPVNHDYYLGFKAGYRKAMEE